MVRKIVMALCLMAIPWLMRAQVRADQVVDSQSLREFVMSAKEHFEKDPDRALRDFATNPDWINGEIYIFVIQMDGTMLFHPISKESIGTNVLSTKDRNGFRMNAQLIYTAKNGGGYLHYFWDNPAIQGDEAHGSLKLSYVHKIELAEFDALIGAGIYPKQE